ncbi:MAG: alkaline phosphatase D [Myxococcota bacterium]
MRLPQLALLVVLAQAAGCAQAPLTRIAFGSCSDQKEAQPHWKTIEEQRPDLLLMMGDNVYGDAKKDPALPELRDAYARLGSNPGFQRVRDAVPIMATWDDHDYGMNDGGAEFPFAARSRQLFLDFWQAPADDPRRARAGGIYQARTFGIEGQRVQVIVLDTRSFRSELRPTDEKMAPGKERYLPDPDPQKTMLGEAQWAWLAKQLKEPADLRLVVSSLQVLADDHGFECWRNLPTERDRLFNLLRDTRANGVVLLTGDRHSGAIYRRENVLPYPLVEVTASALNIRSELPKVPPAAHMLGPLYRSENTGLATIDWQTRTLLLQLRNAKNNEVGRTIQLKLDNLTP